MGMSAFHLNLRLILLALGAIFIVAIFVDGLRRKRLRNQRIAPEFTLDEEYDELEDIDEGYFDEFDNELSDEIETTLGEEQDETTTESYREENIIASELATLREDPDKLRETTLKDLEDKAKHRKHSLASIDKERKRLNTLVGKHQATSIDDMREIEASIPKDENDAPVLVVYSMADEDKPYSGYQLLQSLLSNGLRFGPMNIFHRYRDLSGKGAILFSLARAEEPGVLDVQKMGKIKCKGLTLFMQCRRGTENQEHFDMMLETAHQLSQTLGGTLQDGHHQPFTKDSYVDYHRRIKAYEESILSETVEE